MFHSKHFSTIQNNSVQALAESPVCFAGRSDQGQKLRALLSEQLPLLIYCLLFAIKLFKKNIPFSLIASEFGYLKSTKEKDYTFFSQIMVKTWDLMQ